MEYQVQINNLKAKLQETRARKKQQEDLIMKVENQALKVRLLHQIYIVSLSFGNLSQIVENFSHTIYICINTYATGFHKLFLLVFLFPDLVT